VAKPLIAISQLRYADSLASYLKSQQIPVQVHHVPEEDQYVLVLDNEAHHERALEICQAFIQAPNDPKYQQAAWQHSEANRCTGRTGPGQQYAPLAGFAAPLAGNRRYPDPVYPDIRCFTGGVVSAYCRCADDNAAR
tara:strand:+ start:367 stop:777 length:411 start_codon:yes stop_codon:yes gene_type:complete